MRPQEAGPGQESVWDYPRPPRLEDSGKEVVVVFNGVELARSRRAKRVLETSHPPVYYLPPEDVKMEFLEETGNHSYCEWKGIASYYSVTVGDRTAPGAAWFYPVPGKEFVPINNYIAFYPGKMEACYLDGEKVQAQLGDFYGGWITNEIAGPFKGGEGTSGW